MTTEDLASIFVGSEKLMAFYGGWPSFHDAEIVELHFWRGYLYPGDWDDRNVFPVLTLRILVLQATQPGANATRRDVLVKLRFFDVEEVRLDGFNNENAIVGLSVATQPRGQFVSGEPLLPSLVVTLSNGFGLQGSFRCMRAEVVSAEWAPDGSTGEPRP